MTSLAGKIAVVTGGSSGIGLATAKALAAKGCDVAIVARDPERLERAKAEVEAARREGAQRVFALAGDVSSFEGADEAIAGAIAQLGTPDIVVNAAGIVLPGYFESMPTEYFETCLRNGYFTCVCPTRAVAPHMIARGSGHIVNVSSMGGFVGCVFGYTAYAPSKFAVMGFCEALRSELLPHGVRVSVVCPPDTDTPGLAFEKTLRPPETEVACASAKEIQPQEVAAAIVRAVETGEYYVIPGFVNKLYFRLKGLLPELFFAIFDGDVKKARAARLAAAAEPVAERE